MLDKRTRRSQCFKNFQLQQQQQSFSTCDVLPHQFFDFALADPLSANIYELLKATLLFLDATQSPICSTLRSAIIQFEQFAAISSATIASVVTSSIESQLTLKGFLPPTKLAFDPLAADVTFSDILDAPSTPQLSSESSSSTIDDDLLSLLDVSASQLESQCSLLEQQLQLCEQFHSLRDNFAVCEADNLRLDRVLQLQQADHTRKVSTLDQHRRAPMSFMDHDDFVQLRLDQAKALSFPPASALSPLTRPTLWSTMFPVAVHPDSSDTASTPDKDDDVENHDPGPAF